MANRVTQERVDAIAQEYCKNGLVKSVALITVGYSRPYALHNGLRLFDNVRVKAAIAKIQAVVAEKVDFDLEMALKEFEEARLLAMKRDQPAAAVAATTGKARVVGLDKEVHIGLQQRELDEEEALEAKRIASIRLREA